MSCDVTVNSYCFVGHNFKSWILWAVLHSFYPSPLITATNAIPMDSDELFIGQWGEDLLPSLYLAE